MTESASEDVEEPASNERPSTTADHVSENIYPAEQSVADAVDEGLKDATSKIEEPDILLTAEEAAKAIDEEASKGITKVVSWGAIANEEEGLPSGEGETIDGNELVSIDEDTKPSTEAIVDTSNNDPGVALMANMNEPNLSGTELSVETAAALNNEVLISY